MGERTAQLPINRDVVLLSGLSVPKVVRRLKKEGPGTYLAVKALLADHDYSQARTVLIRENDFGHLSILLALSDKGKRFTVSTWMVDKCPTIWKNISTNSVESQVGYRAEGLGITGQYDVGILVQEPYVNARLTLYEASVLVSDSCHGIVYLISHKKKGADTLLRTLTTDLNTTGEVIARGFGGVRVLKLRKGDRTRRLSAPLQSCVYSPRPGVELLFETAPSLFSPDQVDPGSEFLIQDVLQRVHPEDRISIYDLGSGYGAIGLSLAACLPKSQVVMSDADARAVDVARRNTTRAGLDGRVRVVLSDGPSACVGQGFDLVVSNPPLHTEAAKIRELIESSARLAAKGRRMSIVVEDSRVLDLLASLHRLAGTVAERARISSHAILEYVPP